LSNFIALSLAKDKIKDNKQCKYGHRRDKRTLQIRNYIRIADGLFNCSHQGFYTVSQIARPMRVRQVIKPAKNQSTLLIPAAPLEKLHIALPHTANYNRSECSLTLWATVCILSIALRLAL